MSDPLRAFLHVRRSSSSANKPKSCSARTAPANLTAPHGSAFTSPAITEAAGQHPATLADAQFVARARIRIRAVGRS